MWWTRAVVGWVGWGEDLVGWGGSVCAMWAAWWVVVGGEAGERLVGWMGWLSDCVGGRAAAWVGGRVGWLSG